MFSSLMWLWQKKVTVPFSQKGDGHLFRDPFWNLDELIEWKILRSMAADVHSKAGNKPRFDARLLRLS